MARYARPTANDKAPNPRKTKPTPVTGPIANDPIPTRRVRIPAITIKIAIIVTPRGLTRFCIYYSDLLVSILTFQTINLIHFSEFGQLANGQIATHR